MLTGLAMVMMSSPVYAANTNLTNTGIASLININFTQSAPDPDTGYIDPAYHFVGSAVIGNGETTDTLSPDYWNNITPQMASYVADDPLDPLDLSFTIQTALMPASGLGGFDGITFTAQGINTVSLSSKGFYDSTYKSLMNTYAWTPFDVPATISIAGLDKNTSYDVYVLTQGSISVPKNGPQASNGTQLKLTGYGYDTTQGKWVDNGTFTQTGVSSASSKIFKAGENYMLQTFMTDGIGTLKFTYASNKFDKYAIINGLQIASSSQAGPPATPEPASMLLIGVGGAIISAAKLRKKKSADNPVA